MVSGSLELVSTARCTSSTILQQMFVQMSAAAVRRTAMSGGSHSGKNGLLA